MFEVVFAQAWRCVGGERALCVAVVLSGLRLVGAILWFRGQGIPVFLELLDDVPGHGYVEHMLVMILLELNPTVEIAVPIYGEFIFFPDAPNEVVNVLLTFINHRRPA